MNNSAIKKGCLLGCKSASVYFIIIHVYLNLDRAKLKLHIRSMTFYKILKITRNGYVIPFFNFVSFYILHTTYIYILNIQIQV